MPSGNAALAHEAPIAPEPRLANDIFLPGLGLAKPGGFPACSLCLRRTDLILHVGESASARLLRVNVGRLYRIA